MTYKRTSRISVIHKLLLLVAGLALVAPALAAEPGSRALLLQGDNFAAQGKWDAARSAYVRALEAGAVLDQDFLRCRNLGRAYMNGKSPDNAEAAKWLARALELRPKSSDTRLLLARAQTAAGDYKGAAEQYGVLAKATPANTKYLLAWANALLRSGDSDQAVSVMQDFMRRNPSNTLMRLEYARLLAFAKKYEDAESEYQRVLKSDPANASALVGLAKISSWRGNFPRAVEYYDKVLARNPQNYDAAVGKAFTLIWMGRKDEAHAMLETLAQRNPSDKEVAAALEQLETPPAEVAVQLPPAPPAPPSPIPGLLAAAGAANSRGDYDEALRNYRQVLELNPKYTEVKLQIARTLSWQKKYDESAQQYDTVLADDPGNLVARREKARVLYWARNYDASLPEYARVVKEAETAMQANPSVPPVAINDVRLEYARVLSAAKQYDEAMNQLNLLVPAGQKPGPQDTAVLVEKGRILASQQKYDQSIAAYDQALELDSNDSGARLGKAQVLYWSGRSSESATLLRPLVTEQPQNADANFMLASIERAQGHNARALNLLDKNPSPVAQEMRSTMRQDMRPVLRVRVGFENDREVDIRLFPLPQIETALTLKALRYNVAVDFNVHPNVRMSISQTVTQGLTSSRFMNTKGGQEAISTETEARIAFKVNKYLAMIMGVGGGTSGNGLFCTNPPLCTTNLQGDRQAQFIYDIHPIITYRGFRMDITESRHIADYTPLSAHSNVMDRTESVSAMYDWRQRIRFGAGYYHDTYNVNSPVDVDKSTFENGGYAFLTPLIYRSDKVTLEGGVRYEVYAFDDSANTFAAGFYAPQSYQRYGPTAHIILNPHPKVAFDFLGFTGPKRSIPFAPQPNDWTWVGSFTAQMLFKLGRFQPYFGYGYSNSPGSSFQTTTPFTAPQSYTVHSFVFGFSLRF
jgi:tetratricopeptide (TPR) repeat protein